MLNPFIPLIVQKSMPSILENNSIPKNKMPMKQELM